MPDYKEMYLAMFRANEKAVNLLLAAQRECEEMYLSAPAPELRVLEPGFQNEPPAPGPTTE